MNAVARIAGALKNLVEEYKLVTLLLHANLEIPGMFERFDKSRQFVIMRCKQRERHAGRFAVERLDNSPCNRKSIERTCSATDFVKQHKAMRSRITQDVRRFNHLDHERTEATAQAVARAHTRKDAVYYANACAFGRHKAANLRHEHNKPRLAQVSRFTGHVRARNEHQTRSVRR